MPHGTLRSDFMPKPVSLATKMAPKRTWNNVRRNRGRITPKGLVTRNRIRVTVANSLSRSMSANASTISPRTNTAPRYQFQEYLETLKREEMVTVAKSSEINMGKSLPKGKVTQSELQAIKSEEVMDAQDEDNVAEEKSGSEERKIQLVKTNIPIDPKPKPKAAPNPRNRRNPTRHVSAAINRTNRQREIFQPSARLFWNSVSL